MRDQYERVSDTLQVLSHPVRLQILDDLRAGEACVCHLQQLVHRPQPYVSQQLSKLREANLVEDRRSGSYVYYTLSDGPARRLLAELLGPSEERDPMTRCSCPHCESTPEQSPLEESSGETEGQ